MGSTAPPMGQPLPLQPGEFTSLSQPSVVSWNLKKLSPPSPLYFTRDDVLILQGVSSIVNETVTVNVRMLTIDGVIVPIQQTLQLTTALTMLTLPLPLVEGYILSASVTAGVANVRGQTYVRLWVNRGLVLILNAMFTLIADYAWSTFSASWQTDTLRAPAEGPGQLHLVTGPTPGVGADINWTLPARTRWRVIAITATLTTSATVAARQPRVQLFSNTGVLVWSAAANQALAASLVANVSFGQGVTASALIATELFLPLPDGLTLVHQEQIKTLTANIQAGDQWGQPAALVEEWLDVI